jgi:hypothetical protein
VKVAVVLLALFALVGGAIWLSGGASAPTPALVAGLSDDGLRGAPCPARTLAEQKARVAEGALPRTALGERLRKLFPLGSDAGALVAQLKNEGFEIFAACPNDEEVMGARWLGPNWGQPDAYIYWRADSDGKLIFLDGQVNRTDGIRADGRGAG